MDDPRFVLAQKNCSTNLVSYFRERHNEMQKTFWFYQLHTDYGNQTEDFNSLCRMFITFKEKVHEYSSMSLRNIAQIDHRVLLWCLFRNYFSNLENSGIHPCKFVYDIIWSINTMAKTWTKNPLVGYKSAEILLDYGNSK